MAYDAVAHAEIDIICNEKKYEKCHVTRGWYLCRITGRFCIGNSFFCFITYNITFDICVTLFVDALLVLGYEFIRVLLYGTLFNTIINDIAYSQYYKKKKF